MAYLISYQNYQLSIRLASLMKRLELIMEQVRVCQIDRVSLNNKTIVITGASRGIGLAIALRCAKQGANIAILAKTVTSHPKLPGTIYTAAEQIIKTGGKALPLPCDIRYQDQIKKSIEKVVQVFGGIDILVNNASALDWKGTMDQDLKKYDLMHEVILRGTFAVTKYCLPYLLKSSNPHILNICSPPGHYSEKAMASHLAYSLAKIGSTFCVIGWAEQFKKEGIAVNGLWPLKTIATSVVQNLLGGDEVMKRSRTADIMGDAAFIILTRKSRESTGKFYLDEVLLRENGVTDFSKYSYKDKDSKQTKT